MKKYELINLNIKNEKIGKNDHDNYYNYLIY